jgi:hypothetical protein
LLTLFSVFSGSAFCADKFDIVGLRLGMTPEEALKALRAHGVDESTINKSRRVFSYSDGLKHDYKTKDFLYRINAGKNASVGNQRKQDSITLIFSAPPEGGRLVGIARINNNKVDPVTATQYLDALVKKYGEPTEKQGGKYRWLFGSGTIACRGFGEPDERKGIAADVYARKGTSIDLTRFRNPKVTNLDQCANQLEYSVGIAGERPATRITAFMGDTQAWVKAEQATNKWLADLAEEAAEKRKGQGQGPQL